MFDIRPRSGRRLAATGAAVLLAALVAVPAGAATAATTYVVDGSTTSCSDTGPGTDAAPFCTIGAAAKKAVNPGDTVQVDPGTYREQVTPAASGVPGSPITFTATGPGVVVLGTQDLSDSTGWSESSPNVWNHAFAPASAPTQVFVDAQRLTAASSAASITSGSFFYDATAKLLYVDMDGQNPAAGHTVEAGAQTYGFNLAGRSNIVVDGFELQRQNGAGVHLSGSAGISVNNVTVTDSGSYGMLVESSSTGPSTISNSTVSNSGSAGIRVVGSSGVILDHDVSHDNGNSGITLSGGGSNVVQYSQSYDNVSTNPTNTAVGIDVNGASTDDVLRGNTLHGNQDSGIQVYNGSDRALVVRNISYDNGDHGFDTVKSMDVRYISNTSYGNHRDGFSVEGNATGATLADNIAVDNGLGTGEFDIYVDTTSWSGFSSDYDVVWNSAASTPVKANGTMYKSLAAYAQGTGNEAHGNAQDPMFVDAGSGDFGLSANSPAIDSADAGVTGFEATDHDGQPLVDDVSIPDTGAGTPTYADRGALERQAAGDQADYPPHAALVLNPPTGAVPPGVTVQADASGSSDPDSTGILDYSFDFGDGTVVGPQQQPVASHIYTTSGSYPVTVTVRDANGSGTATQTVTLTDRQPTTYYVDGASSLCSDSGAGTQQTPFCTIGAGAARARAGDTVLVQPATYREQVTVTSGGAPGAPVTFRATGPGTRILGTQDVSDSTSWNQVSATTTWVRAYAPPSAPSQVFVDGTRLTKATSSTLAAGSFYYDPTAKQLYVDIGGGNPGIGHVVEAGAQTYGFKIWNLSDVIVDGFDMDGQNTSAVDVENSSDVTVTGVQAENAGAYGISFSGVTGSSSVANSVADHNSSIGIRLAAGTTGATVQGNVAHDNLFHGISLQNAPANTVVGNTTYGNSAPSGRVADGIDVELASTGVTIEDNTSYSNQDSGIQVYNGAANALVRRNVSYNNGDHGFDCLNSPGEVVVGNTSVGNVTAGINLEGTSTGGTVMDNISVDNGVTSPRSVGDIRVDAVSVQGATVDYNLVYLTSGKYPYAWGGKSYATLTAFQLASGQGAHDRFADPAFVDGATGDLHLKAVSPAIDAASAAAPGFQAADHDGTAPFDVSSVANTGAGTPPFADLGAFEYVGPGPAAPPTARLSLSARTITAGGSVVLDASSSTAPAGSTIASYTFDCGNGAVLGPQASAKATCSYPKNGHYTVTLTVTDTDSQTGTATDTVSVNPQHGKPGPRT